MKELVPVAVLLRDLAGGYGQAMVYAQMLSERELDALSEMGVTGDRRLVLERRLVKASLLSADGSPVRTRVAELTILLDVLGALPADPDTSSPDQPLLYTVPTTAAHLVPVVYRIDRVINDALAL